MPRPRFTGGTGRGPQGPFQFDRDIPAGLRASTVDELLNQEVLDSFDAGASQALNTRTGWQTGLVGSAGSLSTDTTPTYASNATAAPSSAVLDDFNTGASQNLTARAGWAATGVETGKTTFQTDAVPTSVTGSNHTNFRSATWADSECWITVLGTPNIETWKVYARSNLNGSFQINGYMVSMSLNKVQTWKTINSVNTQIGITVKREFTAGDSVGIRVIGDIVQAWYKPSGGVWEMVDSVTDTTYTGGTGTIGFGSSGSTCVCTDFAGGAATGATPTEAINFWNNPGAADESVWVKYGTIVNGFFWLWARATVTGSAITDGYFFYADSSGYGELWKRVGGSSTFLISASKPTPWLETDRVMIAAKGSEITVYYDDGDGGWNVLLTITDAAIGTGGQFGVQVPASNPTRFDSFGGGPLIPSAPAIIPVTVGVSFGASGSITANATVTPATAGVSFGGSGSITAPTSITPAAGSVTFSGTGAIKAPTGITPASGSVTFSGTGSITAATFIVPATAGVSFAGTGAITSIPRVSGTANVTFGGTGSIFAPGAAAIIPATSGVVFSGTGALTAPTFITPATSGVVFSGSSSITAPTGITPASAGVVFNGTGAITSIPRVSGTANVTFNGTGGITSIPQVTGTANVSFAGTGAITAPTRVTFGSAGVTFSGTGAITAGGVAILPAASGVTFNATGSLTAPAFITPATSNVTFAGTGSISAPTIALIAPATGSVAFGTFGSITAPTRITFATSGVVFAGFGDIFAPGPPNPGGGGEWVIWGKPDFPGNRSGAWKRFDRPNYRRPTRPEKRGY